MIRFPRLRFSLRTLLLIVLTFGSGVFLYRDWNPWQEIAEVREQPLRLLHDDSIDAQTVVISPDGEFFTTATRAGWDETAELRIHDSRNGAVCQTIPAHKRFIASVAFSPDGSKIITTGYDSTARIWDFPSGEQKLLVFHDPTPTNLVTCGVFLSSDRVLTASYLGTTWALDKGRPRYWLLGYHYCRDTETFLFANRTRILASGPRNFYRQDWCLRVSDAASGEAVMDFGHGDLDGKRISQDRYLWGLSYGGSVEKWDLNNGKLEASASGDVKVFTVLPNGNAVVSAKDGGLMELNGTDLKELRAWDSKLKDVSCLSATPDGQRLFVGFSGGSVKIYDYRSMQVLFGKSFVAPDEYEVSAIKFFPDNGNKVLVILASTGWECWEKSKHVHLLSRCRPEYWWGVAWLPEFWATLLFGVGLGWSVWRDKRRFLKA
jgi:WD40 repeat protein